MVSSGRKFHLRRALFPSGYYASNSIYQGYISLFYTQLGFSSGQLGLLNAITAAAAVVFAPLWGRVADGCASRRRLLALLSLGAALAFPLKLAGEGLVWQLFAAALFYAFFCALLPLGDAILLSCRDGAFGAYRLAGGVSFAAAGALFGLVKGRLGGGGLWVVSLLLGLTALAALLLPDLAAPERAPGTGLRSLLKNRQLMLLLGLTLPLQMSMSYFYTYYAPRFQALGGSDALLGLGYLLSAASEAPYLLLSGRIYRRWGAQGPMCIAAAMLALRWLLLAAARSPITALLSQLLHGGGFIVVSVSMAQWISRHLPGQMTASGQSLLNMVAFGIARISGNLLGGWIAQRAGVAAGFYAGAGMCILAGLGLVIAARRMPAGAQA